MPDRDVVARKIASATAHLRDVDELLGRPRDEFLDDTRGRDLTAFYLQLAIQDCIDLASHWVSEAGWPPPDDAGSAFDALADHGVIPRDVAAVLRDAVGTASPTATRPSTMVGSTTRQRRGAPSSRVS